MKNEILKILAILYFAATIAVWCVCAYLVIKIIKNRKENVHLWFDTYLNPFILIFLSSKLNEKGIKYRNKLFIFATIFTVLVPFSIFWAEVIK
ncbi:hypothetical protein [Desulfogranum japonicum]|uniref:hypothetical protein n=1 Tax=Desulfogranum japonicum TaxID=231447 RepID=UPI00048EC7B3|nr:hypothetical protein [Desulfogranum japonicum]